MLSEGNGGAPGQDRGRIQRRPTPPGRPSPRKVGCPALPSRSAEQMPLTCSPISAQPLAPSGPTSFSIVPGSRGHNVPGREPTVNYAAEQTGERSVPNGLFRSEPSQDTRPLVPPKKLTPAEWVKAVRQSLGMTQEEFAEKIGVGRSAIAKWEIGVARPRYDSSEKIRQVAPAELREVGLVIDSDVPAEDEVPAVGPTARSLIFAVEAWAKSAGDPSLTDDTEFLLALVSAYAEHQRRLVSKAK